MVTIYALPAILALVAKGVIFFYAAHGHSKNSALRIYIYFLGALTIQNIAEVTFFAAHAQGLPAPAGGFAYFGASIVAIALVLHLALVLVFNKKYGKYIYAVYIPALILEMLLWLTPWLVAGFEPLKYTYTKQPGPLYFMFEAYVISYLITTITLLVYGTRRHELISTRRKIRTILIGIFPLLATAIMIVVLQHFGMHKFNTTATLPIALTFFLAITAYAIHQHRLFDIQFYIPWSKVRQRKTAFYRRIEAMVAELAQLDSIKAILRQLSDVLHCPVALVGVGRPVTAAGPAQYMAQIDRETLAGIDQIVITQELADARPETYRLMKKHGIAAVVPFYPHTEHASGWLLLGDSFNNTVYTPLDFRVVEHLFDKMADTFLDRLLAARSEVTAMVRELRHSNRKLNKAQAALQDREREIQQLRATMARLTRQQPADSLGDVTCEQPGPTLATTMAFVGRDKKFLKALQAQFPATESYPSLQAKSFKAQTALPNILVCQMDNFSAQKALAKLITARGRTQAFLLVGRDAAAFARDYRQQLLGTLTEILPDGENLERLNRKAAALAALVQNVYSLSYTDCPLLTANPSFKAVMEAAHRLAGFSGPIAVVSADGQNALSLARFIHDSGDHKDGVFELIPAQTVNEGDLARRLKLLTRMGEGTIVIDQADALHEARYNTLFVDMERHKELRLILLYNSDKTETLDPTRAVHTLTIPPLSDRPEDMPLLAHYYTLQYHLQAGSRQYLNKEELRTLLAEHPPQNMATFKRAIFEKLSAKGQKLAVNPEVDYDITHKTLDEYVAEFEARLIKQALERTGGNKSKTARLLGLRPNTLYYRLERYGLLEGAKKR